MDFDVTFRGLILFGLEIRYYSLAILAGLLAGIVLAQFEAKRLGENPDHVLNIAVLGVVFGLIGARLYHVIDLWSCNPLVPNDFCYSENIGQIFVLRAGGIGIFGAIAGAAFALVLYVWWVNRRARAGRGQRIRALRWFDIGAPAFLLGQAVGRWGNFFNKELYGPETSLPWGIPAEDPIRHFPWDSGAAAYFHPLFLYESLLSFLGVIVLLWVGRRFGNSLRQGDLLFLYFIWYALERSALEFMRIDNWKVGDVPVAHLVSAVMIVIALLALFLWRRPPYLAPGREDARRADTRPVEQPAVRSRSAERRARRRGQGSDSETESC